MKKSSIITKIGLGILLILIAKNLVINAGMLGHMKDRGHGMYDSKQNIPPPFMPPGTIMPEISTPVSAPVQDYQLGAPPVSAPNQTVPIPTQTEPPQKSSVNPYSSN